ncbi:MAG: hypothetical protein RLZ10_1884 [Bacteroidota bacterium]|jgi:hypothetical protein
MKNILKEELDSIKYLINYDRNKILSENIDSEFNLTGSITPEDLEKFKQSLEPMRTEACKSSTELCAKCTTMVSELGTGNIKEKTIKKCFNCEKLYSPNDPKFKECVDSRGKFKTILLEIQKEKGGSQKVDYSRKVLDILGLLSTLQSVTQTMVNLFKKQPN